jgi:flagellar biosynthesis/type III secretory pathway protein FliH
MSEKLPQSPETSPEKKELSPELAEAYSKVESSSERSTEKAKIENGEQAVENAKIEALKQAISVERGSAEKKKKESGAAAGRRHGVVSKKEQKASYTHHMKKLQEELPAVQRGFSKLIHNPAVEKSSEVIGSTIARPNAILAGAVVAFFSVLIVYLTAKHYGYVLSGFETIGAFIVGWVLGILYDFFRVMITGKKA